MDLEPLERLCAAVADAETFVQLVLTDVAATADQPACRKITVRPAADAMQVQCFTEKQHFTRTATTEEVLALLARPFKHAHVLSTDRDLHVRITKKGKVLLSTGRASAATTPAPREHDRRKQHALPADRPHPLLQALQIQTHAGQIRSAQRGKFHQINQFLEILTAMPLVAQAHGPLRVVDCGCGAAYLTFAAHHVLHEQRGLDVHTVGIDTNAELIAKCSALQDQLGITQASFEAVRIADYTPPARPHLVLSLHACDTATDEAIAFGIRHRAEAILTAPCCQHELRDQLAHDAMHALLRHGVLRSRLADLVTDAARAAILRLKGYRCDVIEFVSPEHTGKNVMLRAERRSSKPLPGAVEEYAALRQAWRIAPILERLVDA